jgi:hypothetical protein
MAQIVDAFAGMLAGWPEPVRDLLVARPTDPAALAAGMRERSDITGLLEQLRDGGPQPDVPLTVRSGPGHDPGQAMMMPESELREMIAGTQRLFTAIAEAAPRGEHRTLPDAAHSTIPLVRPDAVAHAVRDLLARM